MANTYKVLGQSFPAATTNTDIYTVPSGAQAVASTLAVCNTAGGTTFRVAVRIAGATLTTAQYIVFDNYISSNDTVFLTLGISLNTGDVVTVFSGANTLTFNLFGTEVV